MSKRTILVLLITILLVAGVARLYQIGERSYWVDEDASLRLAQEVPSHLASYWRSEPHPPLYYLLLHGWIAMFGESETSTRSLSALFGVLAVALIYLVGCAVSDRTTGLLSAAILALSAFHIAQSQEARMYALLATLTLLATYAFIKLLREHNTTNTILYVTASVLLLYTHLYGLFVLLAHNIILLYDKAGWRARTERWLSTQGSILLLFTPWIIVLYWQSRAIAAGAFTNVEWIASPGIWTIIETFRLFAGNTLVLIALVALTVIAALRVERKHGKGSVREKPFLFTLLVVPILLPLLISILVVPIYNPKYAIGASVFLYLLAARGLVETDRRLGHLFAYALTAVLLALLLAAALFHYAQPALEPWREVASFLDENAASDERIIVTPSFATASLDRYLERDLDGGATTLWIVTRAPAQENPPPGYRRETSTPFGDLTVSEYRTAMS